LPFIVSVAFPLYYVRDSEDTYLVSLDRAFLWFS
jgi:hypothetical protein